MLTRSEYDISYFDGNLSSLKHNAGYSTYNRITWAEEIDGVMTEMNRFKKNALSLLNRFQNPNQKVMVLCCAKGYLVKEMLNLGFDVYGIDWSNYAITQGLAEMPELAGRIWEADAKTEVQTWGNNEYDLIISVDSLCCFTDLELNGDGSPQNRGLIYHLNRKTSQQFHIVLPIAPIQYYNPKSISDWIALDWEQGTVIADKNGNYQVK